MSTVMNVGFTFNMTTKKVTARGTFFEVGGSSIKEKLERSINWRGVQGTPLEGVQGQSPRKLRGFRHLNTVKWAYFDTFLQHCQAINYQKLTEVI